jgi:hypothetical protein
MAKYFLNLLVRMTVWLMLAVIVGFLLSWPLFYFRAPTVGAFLTLAVMWIITFAGIFTVLEWQSKYGPGQNTRSQAFIKRWTGL